MRGPEQGSIGSLVCRESEAKVGGQQYSLAAIREGVMAGTKLLIRFVGKENDKLKIGFFQAENGGEGNEIGNFSMEMFRRYECIDPYSGKKIKLRASIHRFEGKKMLHVAIDTSLKLFRFRKTLE